MRIISVHTTGAWGGVERYTRDLLIGLAERGHDVVAIVSPRGALAAALEGSAVRVRTLDLGPAVGWHRRIGPLNHVLNGVDLYANPARRRLERELDALHSECPIDLLHAQAVKEKLWVTSYGARLRIPVSWTVHAPMESWMKISWPGRVHRRATSRVDSIVAVNGAALSDYRAWGFEPGVFEVVYNGFDLDAYVSGNRAATRESLAVAPETIAVLMPARPYVEKGVGVLLDALSMVASTEPGLASTLKVFVAGGSSHVRAFDEQARARGIADTVVFLGHRDDVPDLLAASDIVILPSLNEGLPYAISEAMAAGKPVIASRVGGVPEMIEDGDSGVLIDAGDARELLGALKELAGSAQLRQRMGTRGRTLAEERYGLGSMVGRTEQVFAATVARRSSLRVLLVAAATSTTGGGERHVADLIAGYAAQEDLILGLVSPGGGDLPAIARAAGAMCFDTPIHQGLSLGRLWAVRSAIREFRPDIVHAHGSRAAFFARLADCDSAARCVYTLHGIHVDRSGSALRRWVLKRVEALLRRRTAAFITVCDADLERGIDLGLITPGLGTRVWNGVRPRAGGDKAGSREVLGIDAGQHVALSIGRFHHQKDQATLLRAWAEIAGADSSVRLMLVGGGPLEEQLRALAQSLGIEASVHFVAPTGDVNVYYDAADVFVLSSLWEGLPYVVLEAMAAGLPVVSTSVDGIPEAVVDGMTGVLVPVSNPAALAAAVADMLSDPRRAQSFGSAGRARVEALFTTDAMVEQTLDVYKEAISRT